MANPPVNRRPGVDADIFQGEWVRGYDVPAGDQTLPTPDPCDLIVSNGKSQITQAVSDLIFASRTDSLTQPIFVMAQGVDPTAPIARVNFHIGDDDDPNGLISGVGPGSLYASYGTPGLWQLQGDDTTWVKISDDLGGEDLAETLAIGNFTGGNNIRITNGDFIIGVDDTVGVGGANVNIQGGGGLAAVGNGGSVLVSGGTSAGGVTGNVNLVTPGSTSTGATGAITLNTGPSLLGGNSGAVQIRTGDAGAAGIGGSVGNIGINGGNSLATGSLNVAGGVSITGGFAQTAGQGGRVFIFGGNATGAASPIIVATAAGQGGEIRVIAGSSAGTRPGGTVTISGGTGGSAGAAGGNVSINPGAGGGGFPAGEAVVNGILRASNLKRGNGNPNSLAVAGDEGDVYQRLDTGVGQLWLNTNGSPTGWRQLAFSGDFIESFEQMQWGYLAPAGMNPGGPVEDEYADVGLWEGMRPSTSLGGTVTRGGALTSGPILSFSTGAANTSRAALELPTGFGSAPHAVEHQFVATFRFGNSVSNDQRAFIGFSTTDAATQLASVNANPGAPESYIGFVADTSQSGNWRVVTANGLGTSGPFDTGVSLITTSVTDGYYFVIDTVDYITPVIRFFVLDDQLNLLSSISVPTSVPTAGTRLRPIVGIRALAGAVKVLRLLNASLANQASIVAQGGGVGGGAPTLAEVLVNGNETGANVILVNQGSGLLGVTDDNLGDGASFGVFGGATTGAGNDTGSVTVGSGNAFGGGAINAGASTGFVFMSSGTQFGLASLGDTGLAQVQSGDHLGTDGNTGDVVIRSGLFTNGAAGVRVQGDLLMAPGGFNPDASTTTGEVIIKGGSSSTPGTTGGDVTVMSGENNSASGDTGDIVVETFPANIAGDSGDIDIRTGDGGGVSGDSGTIVLVTGAGVGAGDSGLVSISSGNAANGTAGQVVLACGISTVGDGAVLAFAGGDTLAGGQVGGNIILSPGTGPAGDGVVEVQGKLTVTGLIDPTGLLLDGQPAVPAAVPAGNGLLWIDSTGAPSRLIYTDDAGTDHDISTGGGATTLAALTDVSLGPLNAGEVLTYNGVDWTNLPGAGGSPLQTILGIGNTTGALPIVVSDTLGSRITSDGDLVLDPANVPGQNVVIDGLRWPAADGVAGYVLTTNGAGVLSFQPGGGGGTETFAEQFVRMQFGSFQANEPGAPPAGSAALSGIFSTMLELSPGPGSSASVADGTFVSYVTGGLFTDAGLQLLNSTVTDGSRFRTSIKFNHSSPGLLRSFVGVTTASLALQVGVAAPLFDYIGIQLDTSIPQATFHFVTDAATGVPTRVNTTIAPGASAAFWLDIDWTVSGQVTLTLYDRMRMQLAQTVFVANLPSIGSALTHLAAIHNLEAPAKTMTVWSISTITRADLLSELGGGGGNQNLSSVLGFGNDTNGIAIQGTDSGAGSGTALDLLGGSSTGAGGSGGSVNILTGSPDPAGNGSSGDFQVATSAGAGTGDSGDIQMATGSGGAGGGDGGDIQMATGDGAGVGTGGNIQFAAGDGGAGGGNPGFFSVATGSGAGGNVVGGRVDFQTGDGSGTGNGGGFLFEAGDGGGAGGDGGSFVFSVGAGMGGGVDGTFTFNGDMTVDGKLTVTGMIDPPGLLMSSSGFIPFTPVGTEGGIWVNAAGELIYSNTGGDLNLSTAIGGGMSFLDALLTAGYGFLGPGNPAGGAQSYGVYGSSVVQAVDPGPPPASITFSEDTEGPFLNLALAASPGSEAFLGTADLFVRRDQRFRARVKFQVTSPAHTNERIFIGFTDDPALVTPSTQLSTVDDPPALEYVGLREDLAGFNLQFVARGSGGAMVPIFAIPTDALVHYLEIDATDAGGDVTFTVYAADGTTVEATHTEPSSFLLPTLANALRPFAGLYTDIGATPRGLDFYFSTIVTRADVVDAVVMGGGGGGTPTLAAVLAAGNNAGLTVIEADGGINGGTVTLALAGGTVAGAGSPATSSLAANVADSGGGSTLAAGAGGGAAGAGGSTQVSGGAGSGTGAGGSISVTAGDGGATGDAGSVTVSSGDPGAGGSFGTTFLRGDNSATVPPLAAGLEDGGVVAVGATTAAGATGGAVVALRGEVTGAGRGGPAGIAGGNASAGSNASGGPVTIVGGAGDGTAGGGNVTITTGTGGASGSGGSFTLLAAPAAGGSGGDGGDITIQASAGDGAGDAGSIYLFGDGAVATPTITPGGDIQIAGAVSAGNASGGRLVVDGGSGLIGGTATLQAGDGLGGSGLIGGTASLIAGTGDGAAAGGFVLVRGGQGGATGDGGDAQIRGGGATGGANTGGDVRLIPGTGPGGDGLITTEGVLHVAAPIDPAGPGFQHGAFVLPGGPGPFPVPFNIVFAAPPSTVLITLETGPAVACSIAPGSIAAGGFTLLVGGPLAPGDRVHWTAYL